MWVSPLGFDLFVAGAMGFQSKRIAIAAATAVDVHRKICLLRDCFLSDWASGKCMFGAIE